MAIAGVDGAKDTPVQTVFPKNPLQLPGPQKLARWGYRQEGNTKTLDCTLNRGVGAVHGDRSSHREFLPTMRTVKAPDLSVMVRGKQDAVVPLQILDLLRNTSSLEIFGACQKDQASRAELAGDHA